MESYLEDLDVQSPESLQSGTIGKILVPVDGSDVSFNAVEYAVNLAERYNSEISLVHIVPTSVWNYCLMTEGWNPVPVCTIREMEAEGERLLLSVLSSVKESGVEVDAQIDYGRPANKIVQIAKEENFDLIVMGSNGRGVIARLLFGSVSAEVFHKAPCPVLVVKELQEKNETKKDAIHYESWDNR
ncbi:MAG: universal stress protein [Candidatus Bathyarchaeota archaeon]|nr:universal stress protein [Candidatus Bathyarchaeota archaeon]